MKTALTIAGSDSGGGAGIQADLKTFAALGVHGTSVITSLTAQNTRAVEAVHDLPPDFIEAQFDAVHRDFEIGAAKTGMLSSIDTIETVKKKLGRYPLVVDPVMVAESGGRLLREDAVKVLKGLFPRATVVTPNLAEAGVLAGMKVKTVDDMKRAAREIANHGCSVLVKGGHLNATDILYHSEGFHVFEGELMGGGAHGSGCTMAAALCAGLAKGYGLVDAVVQAKGFITRAIFNAYSPGKGARVVNQFQDILEASERYRVIEALNKVVAQIEASGFAPFIPEVGTNVAYALPWAGGREEVCAITGRIVRVAGRVKVVGRVEFGASKHVAAIVLAAMKHDPSVRSAMNIRYSPENVDLCKGAGLSVSTFSREDEPEGVSSMEWGTDHAIKVLGTVPDVIYDKGGVGKEAMIRILGKDPGDVWAKVKGIIAASKVGGS